MSEHGLVVFDLGGVLVRIRRGFESCARAAGIPWERGPLSESESQAFNQLMGRYQAGYLELADFSRDVAALMGDTVTATQIERMHDAILVGPYEGAAGVLERLMGRGVAVAILSNTCGAHWAHLAHYSSVAVVPEESRFLSFQLGLIKPDPAIYERVEALSGYGGADILFLDDGFDQVESARRCGWRAEQIEHDRVGMAPVVAALESHGF